MLIVTGASGFVGRHLLQFINNLSPAEPGFAGVLPLYHETPVDGGYQVNLANSEEAARLFRSQKITGVIHLAAESRTGICEQDPRTAYLGNVVTTANLLQASAGISPLPYFLYISTDMVFSGHEGGYRADDPVAPINEYGRSKAQAESLVSQYPGKWSIVRPALIYGATIDDRGSSFSWTLDGLMSGTASFFTDEIRTPVYVNDLVRLLWAMWQTRQTGIIHAGGPERLSRFAFASRVAALWKLELSQDQTAKLSDNPANASRPRDLTMVSTHAHKITPFTPLEHALLEIKELHRSA